MKKDKINFITSLIFCLMTFIVAIILYSLNLNGWFIDFIKDLSIGIFSGTIVSSIILYFILKKEIYSINEKYCYALNDLLSVYEYLLSIEEFPFGMDENKSIKIVESVDYVIDHLEYETMFNRNIEPYQLVSVKTLYLRTILNDGRKDISKLQGHYMEILQIIKDLSKKPNCFEMEIIKKDCEKKINKMNNFMK